VGAYVFRRLLLMIPTLFGILIINFIVLRMEGPTLQDQMNVATSGEGAGARKAEQASANVESYLGRFRRTGNDLPAVINLRGFSTKAGMVETLGATSRASGLKESKRNRKEKDLWLYGPMGVEPLGAVLADDALAVLHGPASMALSLCCYIPLNREDTERMAPERLEKVRTRNAALAKLRISYVNSPKDGFVTTDQDHLAKRAALLSLIEADRAEYAHSVGRALGDMFVRTGFIDFLAKLVTGNLYSETRKDNVFTVIGHYWYVTFWLNLLSIILAWGISIPLGIRSARRIGTWEDRATTNTLFMMWSLPSFFVGTILLHHLCTNTSSGHAWFPNRGLSSPDSLWYSTPKYLLDLVWHGTLPLLVLCYGSFTSLSRYMRGNMLEQLGSDYVRTARAKGADEDQVVYRHAMRNSMVTMITLGSGLLAELFGGFVFVEFIFSIPGLGWLLLDAARQHDAPLLMGATLISVLLLLFGILVADLLYAVVDPRIRSRYG
jgi:peptide/nickel transport system permease protein